MSNFNIHRDLQQGTSSANAPRRTTVATPIGAPSRAPSATPIGTPSRSGTPSAASASLPAVRTETRRGLPHLAGSSFQNLAHLEPRDFDARAAIEAMASTITTLAERVDELTARNNAPTMATRNDRVATTPAMKKARFELNVRLLRHLRLFIFIFTYHNLS